MAKVHAPLVYYARRDGLIKIGTTTEIRARMTAQGITDLLAVEPGSYDLEDQRHTEFAVHRLSRKRGTGNGRGNGPAEWFRPGASLMAHIEALSAVHLLPEIRTSLPSRYGRSPSGQEYNTLHTRMRLQRGKASLQQCVRCHEPAAHWAQLHETDGWDIWNDYVPMCVKCHGAYDRGGVPKSAEHREQLAEYARNHRTPEHLRKISEALTGRPGWSPGMTGRRHSAETKERIRAKLAGRKISPETLAKRQATIRARRQAPQQGNTLF